MANFASLTANLNLDISNFVGNLQKANQQANKFATTLQGQINTGIVDPTKKAKFEFKDVARIVQGIVISKAFYSGLNAIRNATDAVWEFGKELEYAHMVYSNMFGDTKLASEFINVLKDFAAITPFTFTQAEQAAKRLLAYGIQAENVMYVMRGVLAASTVQQNPAVIESISRAIGQIYTKGRLMNEEMRQLAEAGIPAYDILQEKLGLTNKQLQNLGKNAIPASTAINALVDGITERFGTTLDMSSMTLTGILSNIKDNAVMLFSGIFSPMTKSIWDIVANIGEFIAAMRSIYDLRGLGGIFEDLVPPELQNTLRTLVVNLMNLWSIIKTTLIGVLKALKTILLTLVHVLNALLPIINMLLGFISMLSKAITENETFMRVLIAAILAAAAAWGIYKIQALSAMISTVVIKGIITAVRGLITALTFLVAHPVWAMLALGIGLLVALTGASDKFSASISKLFKNFTSFGGVDPDKVLLPETKEREADLNKFNKRLGETSESMDELAGTTGKAAKAAKALLSFDEVFSLKSPDEGASGIADNIDNLMAGVDIGDFWDNTAFDTVANDFVDNLLGAFGGKDKILGAGIGAILGAALGMILGGPLGAKIGAVAGAIAGWFWDEIATAFNLTDVGTVALPLSTALGAMIGGILGGPGGAIIGAGIGALVGWIIDSITRGIETGDWSKVGLPVGMGIGAGIGMLVGGPLGALIGAAIGSLVGWIVDMFVKGFTEGDWNVSGLSLGLGTGIGAAIGMIAGGPVGALIGAAVGALVGWIIGLIVDNWSAIADWFKGVGSWFAEVGKSIGQFFVDIGNGIAEFFGGIGTWFADGWNTITTWFADLLTGIGNFFASVWTTVSDWAGRVFQPFIDAAASIWDGISVFLTDVWNGITTVATDIFNAVTTVATDIFNAVSTVLGRIFETVGNILGFIKDLFVKWGSELWAIVSEKFEAIWETISTKMQEVWDTVVEKVTGVWNAVSEWFQKAWDTVTEKLTGIWNTVSEKFQAIWDKVSEKLQAVWNTVSEKFQAIWDKVSEKLQAVWTTVSEKFQAIWDVIKTKLSGAWESVKTFFGNMYDSIKTSISNMYDNVKTGISNIYNAFKNWISDMWNNVFGKFFDWIDDGIKKLREFFGLDSKAKNTDTSYTVKAPTANITGGHSIGGVFNREHIARFAEGDKTEAIIPLENDTAMQPFVDAVSNGLMQVLMPLVANLNERQSNEDLRPLYVGNLIADDRSLRELQRRMNVIQITESQRRG